MTEPVWKNKVNAHKATPEELDTLPLTRLPKARKQKLWAAIKTQDPAQAEVMTEAMQAIGALFPGKHELMMSRQDIEKYERNN